MSGTVTVDDTGSVTGSGDAYELFLRIFAEQTADNPLPDPATPDADFDGTPAEWSKLVSPLVVKVKKAWAREARAHAQYPRGKALAADASLTNSLSSIGLSVDLVAGKTYRIEWDLRVQCSGAGGLKLAIDGPAGTLDGFAFGNSSSLALFTSVELSAVGGAGSGTFCTSAAAANRMLRVVLTYQPSADGTVDLQLAAITAPQTGLVRALSTVKCEEMPS